MLMKCSFEFAGKRGPLRMESVCRLLREYIAEGCLCVDPFSGDSEFGTLTNYPGQEPFARPAQFHSGAMDYLAMLRRQYGKGWADAVILNPPPFDHALYNAAKRELGPLLKPGGIAVTIGWSSGGFGEALPGFEMLELLLVNHGASWNDTIVTVERKSDGRGR